MAKKHLTDSLTRSDRKVVAIGAAAEKLFSTKGYIETSMDDVATAARISKGGMYHYFSSKSELLYFVLSGFMEVVLQDLEKSVEKVEKPLDKIRFIIFRHVKIYAEHMYAAKVLLNEAHNLPSRSLKEIKSREKVYFAIIARVLSSCVSDSLDKDRLTVITFNLLGMCNWIYSWYNPKGAITPEQLSQIIFENFTSALSKFHQE